MSENLPIINSYTRLYCILGNPVRHSLSPFIHNLSFMEKNINAVYLAFEPDSIGDSIAAMRTIGIAGASVTIPFKIDAINHMDELDPLAEIIGSINTIHNSGGKLKGYNTDGYGAIKSLTESDIKIAGTRFLVIGNGGSARAIAFTILDEKGSIILAGRSSEKVEVLKSELKKYGDDVSSILIKNLTRETMNNVDVIINTTPIGMHPDEKSIPIPENLILQKHAVFDIVYSPEKTRLLATAHAKGCRIVNGLDMLINQGIKQFEIWTGESAPAGLINQELKKKLYRDRK